MPHVDCEVIIVVVCSMNTVVCTQHATGSRESLMIVT